MKNVRQNFPTPTNSHPEEVPAAYAQALFSGCAAALSTLLNRSVAIEIQLPIHAPTEPLATLVNLPWVVSDARFARGLSGAHEILMSTEDAVGLARLVLGEESSDATQMTSDHHDALREMLNQMFGSASSQLKVFFNKPVTLSFAELRLVESAENWTPHAAAVAMGHLTVDGVPHARLAVTIPSTILDEAAIALRGDEKEEIDGSGLPPGLEMILDIEMPVTVELGRTRMPIKEILALGPGSIIELDKLAGEPVDLLVNERAIAKGEVVVIDENFGLRLTQISHAAERIRSLS